MNIMFIDVEKNTNFHSYNGEAYLPPKGSFIEFEQDLEDDKVECNIFKVIEVITHYKNSEVCADIYLKFESNSLNFRKKLRP